MSEWLNNHAVQVHGIAGMEIGYIGYQTNMNVIDLYGLVTPELLPWINKGSEAGLQHSLRLFSPDYVLLPIEKAKHLQIMAGDSRYEKVQTYENRNNCYEKITRGEVRYRHDD